MLKKTFISSMIFLSTTSPIFAKAITPYVGGGVSLGGLNQGSGLNGPGATVFGGAGKLIGENDQYYLGGEVGFSLYPHSQQNVYSDTLYRTSYGTGYGLNASIIPGIMLTKDTMLYGKVGLATNYYPKDSITFATQVGVGIQTSVAKNWDVRTEYISYGSMQSNQVGVGLSYKFL